MAVLKGLEPAPVFRYFEEICGIPHGSGNTKKISDYCVRFAKEHGLRYIQDQMNNVIIFKEGTEGYEQSAPVIIQGHLDMVCEKTNECAIDFEKDGLSLQVKDSMITAEGTTLGGDDGIAVAYALAILDSVEIAHPPLEVVFTVDEEVGMLGAAALDCTPLQARIMLNVDSEEEGVLLTGCAGGVTVNCHLPINYVQAKGVSARLAIDGLTGGHSGVEIDKGRANANQLLGRALDEIGKEAPFSLASVSGGLKDNAIPRQAAAMIVAEKEKLPALEAAVKKYEKIFQAEYAVTDPALTLMLTACEDGVCTDMKKQPVNGQTEKDMNAAPVNILGGAHPVMDEQSAKRVIAALVNLPGGVCRMSADIPGLVQTSLNLGILKTLENEAVMSLSVRSSVGTEKEALVSRITNLMEVLGGSTDCAGDYPAWEYKRDSRLRDLMVTVFEEQYGRKPAVEAIHAGLECGLFAGKLPGLDCISFGPDITDIHTTAECLHAASVERVWNYILEILRRLR